jgi:hypothetical protein
VPSVSKHITKYDQFRPALPCDLQQNCPNAAVFVDVYCNYYNEKYQGMPSGPEKPSPVVSTSAPPHYLVRAYSLIPLY